MAGSKLMYWVESHWLSRESLISGWLNLKTRLPSCGTSSCALVKSSTTAWRLQAGKKITTHRAVRTQLAIRIIKFGLKLTVKVQKGIKKTGAFSVREK